MYSFLRIGIDSDIEVTYNNEIFRIKVTEWKHYKLFRSILMRLFRRYIRLGKFKTADIWHRLLKHCPTIQFKNKKHAGEVFEYSIYKSDDMFAKLFDLQKEGLRCKLDLIIPCIQEDILLEFFHEKDID